MPPKRPAACAVGELHAYPIRPPLAGRREWYWRVVLHRDNRQVTVPGASRRLATAAVAEHLARLLVDGVPAEAKGAPVEVRSVYDLLAAFVADVDKRPGGRRTTYRQHRLRTLRLEKLVGDVAVANLSAATLDRLVRQLVAEGMHRGGIMALLATLRAAWTWGVERELIPMRPLARVRLPPAERVMDDYTPTGAEVAAVLGHLGDAPAWVRQMLALLWATGCRPHEVCALTRGDVHRWVETVLRDGQAVEVVRVEVHVPGATKTGARVVGIGEGAVQARAVLDEILGQPGGADDRLLGVARKTTEMIARYLDPACARAEVPRWTMYGLRRLASSTLIEAGVDPVTYAAQMGHSYAMGLRIYARTKPSAVRSAADLLGVEGGGTAERWRGKRRG